MRYRNFGIVFEEPLFLPEMEALQTDEEPDFVIEIKKPDREELAAYNMESGYFVSEKLIYADDNGNGFCIEKGKRAYIWNDNDKEPGDFNLSYIILLIVPALAMIQRGHIVIHGSGLVYDNKAFIVSGVSGSGKSTTAINLLKDKNIGFLSDDVCVVKETDEGFMLFPGPPVQKICPDVMKENDGYEYFRIGENDGKYYRKIKEQYITKPVCLTCMYIITESEKEGVHITMLNGKDAFYGLTHNMFRGEVINDIGMTPARMTMFVRTCNAVKINIVEREGGKNTYSEVIDAIMRDVSHNRQQ